MKHTNKFLAIFIASIIAISFAACTKDDNDDDDNDDDSNQTPTCTISSPADGDEITQGNTVTISVEADDSDGSIAEVRFYIDGVGKGSANSFPYNYEWITTEEEIGSHTIKAEAKDNAGATKTDEITVAIVSSGGGGTFTDPRDGKVYQTVTIGNQEWMAENLAYEPSSGNYWAYDNNNSNVETYGYLYDWETACDVCPDGWHLPTDAEWTELTDYLGGSSVAGGKLKATGTIEAGTGLWVDPNTGATNETGFTALPSGFHAPDGTFGHLSRFGYYWTSTEYDAGLALFRSLLYEAGELGRDYDEEELGFSVRCLKD